MQRTHCGRSRGTLSLLYYFCLLFVFLVLLLRRSEEKKLQTDELYLPLTFPDLITAIRTYLVHPFR